MTYQPSFQQETSTPVIDPALDHFGWLAAESRDGVPDGRVESGAEQPRRRVPDSDIIDVGPHPSRTAASEPVDVRDLALTAPKGSAPAAARNAGRARLNLTRPLLVLLILEVAVFGGNYLRKRYVESQVIVVPPAASERSVIT